MAEEKTDNERERMGVAAIVTYIALAQFTFVLLATFALAAWGPKGEDGLDPVMVGLLGTIIAAVISLVTGAAGYWIGASAGGKVANAALAQLAGAGPPPPSTPMAPDPATLVAPEAASDFPTEERK